MRRKHLLPWIGGALIALTLASAAVVGVSRWLGLPPYGGPVVGTVVSKRVVIVQGKKTRATYFLLVKTPNGQLDRVAVPAKFYRDVPNGWNVERRNSVLVATSPDGGRTMTSAAAF